MAVRNPLGHVSLENTQRYVKGMSVERLRGAVERSYSRRSRHRLSARAAVALATSATAVEAWLTGAARGSEDDADCMP